jgi:hypothetical protein
MAWLSTLLVKQNRNLVNLLASKDALTYRTISLDSSALETSEKVYDPSDEAEYNRIIAQRPGENIANDFPEFDPAAFLHEGDFTGTTETNDWASDLEIQR